MRVAGYPILLVALAGCGAGTPAAPHEALLADASRTLTSVDTNGGLTARVVLDATASRGVDGRAVSYTWSIDGATIGVGPLAQVDLEPGVYEVMLRVEDVSGDVSVDTLVVVVTSAPTIGFTLSVRVVGGGVTVPAEGETTYPAGTSASLLAVASEGYRFERWTGDVETTNATATLVMDRSKSVTAEFAPYDAVPRFYLPFAAGRSLRVSQGNHGAVSHRDRFAWDFPMYVGEPVLASGAGRVIDILESSLRNQDSSTTFGQPANFVRIDHGFGVQSLYGHLDFNGVVVAPGQFVSGGQVIGYACNTGVSTGPHLHYEVQSVRGESIPSAFFEVALNSGIPLEGDEVRSGNQLRLSSEDYFRPSLFPLDAFAQNQVELTGRTPPAFFHLAETDYTVTGRVLDDSRRVCVALVHPTTGDTVFCDLHEVADDGTFTIPYRIPGSLIGRYFFAVISGPDGAEGTTDWSMLILPKPDGVLAPTAVAAAPTIPIVDFLESALLDGTASTGHRVGALSYHWAHASGPPVSILSPFGSTTEFSVLFGEGIERVAFQLVVFDGVRYSQPVEVAYLMPDTFFVKRSGMADDLCHSADTCPLFDPPPTLLSFSTQVLVGWVEAVNARRGDRLAFTITDPDGQIVASSAFDVIIDPPPISFWRFVMTSAGLELKPGLWVGTFVRNTRPEAQVEFRVSP